MAEPSRHRAKLVYLKHQCNPEDLLNFIEMDRLFRRLEKPVVER